MAIQKGNPERLLEGATLTGSSTARFERQDRGRSNDLRQARSNGINTGSIRDQLEIAKDMVTSEDIKSWIEAGLPGSQVEIDGDGAHFNAVIVCPDFAGKSMIEQHKMVYASLGDKMKAEIHALSMKTLTPEQAQ